MKLNRIMWGIVLLFIGGILLLENFGLIEFYWFNIKPFWPVLLIIAGVNILFNRNKSQTGAVISILILLITLCFLFYKGQQPPEHKRWADLNFENDLNFDHGERKEVTFSHPYRDSATVKTVLNISGSGTSFDLKGPTDSLIIANVQRKAGTFSLETEKTDSITTVNFKMKGRSNWEMGDGGNDVDLRLNTDPNWEINMNMGAGEIDFDISAYKVRTFNFDGGAAALEVKVGDLLPITDVNIKTGVADVKIEVPAAAGCKIRAKTGLSSKDFTGFTKLSDGTYETSNYNVAVKKIFVNLDGGLSNFEVKRY